MKKTRFNVGDTVRFQFGIKYLRARIVEYRGPLGIGGEQIYTISYLRGRHMQEIPESELSLVKARPAAPKRRVTRRKKSA